MNEGIGDKYNKIAQWWHDSLKDSEYGLTQVDRAIAYCTDYNFALDVGCGSGGRIIRRLLEKGFKITGIDASVEMINIAKVNHPTIQFHHADICHWHSNQKFDLIIAWDSIFHLPLAMHSPVISKLCDMLQKEGILLYTFGDASGEHESDWRNDKFYYSSVGISENIRILMDAGCECRHLELDQFPEKHVVIIARKK